MAAKARVRVAGSGAGHVCGLLLLHGCSGGDAPAVSLPDPGSVAQPVQSAAPGDLGWPVAIEADTSTTHRSDLNHDGILDAVLSGTHGGSGWHQRVVCVREGVSGHRACAESADTPYSWFYGWRLTLSPAVQNDAEALLFEVDGGDPRTRCAPPSASSAAQGAMFALQKQAPFSGAYTPRLDWHAGRPADQVRVCLTPREARAFPGALIWSLGEALDDWTVVYVPGWPAEGLLSGSRGPTPIELFPIGSPIGSPTGSRRIYQQGAALAVYDPVADRHAWIGSWWDGDSGFKVDRWPRIAGVAADGPSTLTVTLRTLNGDQNVQVELP